MQTFAGPRAFVDHPGFARERRNATTNLPLDALDAPIRDLIADMSSLSCAFTLQSCYGHFLHALQRDDHDLSPLPGADPGTITYRIAYVALCIENGEKGKRLRDALASLTEVDPDFIQFGSPEWFWNRRPNSYALQVEPLRFADRDKVKLDYAEALMVEKARNRFFEALREAVGNFKRREE